MILLLSILLLTWVSYSIIIFVLKATNKVFSYAAMLVVFKCKILNLISENSILCILFGYAVKNAAATNYLNV